MPSKRGLGVLLRVLLFPAMELRCPHVPILQGIIKDTSFVVFGHAQGRTLERDGVVARGVLDVLAC